MFYDTCSLVHEFFFLFSKSLVSLWFSLNTHETTWIVAPSCNPGVSRWRRLTAAHTHTAHTAGAQRRFQCESALKVQNRGGGAKRARLSGLGKGVNVGQEFFPLGNLGGVEGVPEGSGRFWKVRPAALDKVSLLSPPPSAVTRRRPVQHRIDFTPVTIH